MQWGPQQAAAIDAVASWYRNRDKQIFRVFGYAGTGKTTLARHFASDLKGPVYYCAFTGKAAMVMRKNGCAGASTIHSTIYGVEVDEKTGVTKFMLKSKLEFERAALFVIDECSMVDEQLGKDLASFGVPILVLGDPAQLPAVGGAGYFTECEPDVMLTEIHRQAAESPIIQMATTVREGGRLHIGQYGSSKVITRADLEQQDVTGADQVLVGVNKTRESFNRRLREIQGRTSTLPVPDDRLVCLKNDRAVGLFNGGLWTVLNVRKRIKGDLNDHCIRMDVTSADFPSTVPLKVRVREECFDGRMGEVPWQERRGTHEFDYGYALTVHKGQGSQWNSVCLFDESGAFGEHRARHLYTGITRAADQITVVI